MTLLSGIFGGCVALGLMLIVAGIQGVGASAPRGQWRKRLTRLEGSTARLGLAVLGGLLALMLTGWWVAAVAIVAFSAALPRIAGSASERRAGLATTEAAAAWAEMLRDTLAGGQGLAACIDATAKAAPQAIRPAVVELATSLRYSTDRDRVLLKFAARVNDPTTDRVVAGLLLHRGKRLGEMLGAIAQSAREHAQMQMRVESGRGRIRWTARFVCVVTVGMALVLAIADRSYLAPYNSASGQLMLVIVVGCFGAGLWWLGRIAHEGTPPRLLTDDGESAGQGRP